MKKFIIGFDVGGTKTEGVLGSFETNSNQINILNKLRQPTVNISPEAFSQQITDIIFELCSAQKMTIHEIGSLSVGLPGSLHPQSKIMMNGNTEFLIGYDLKNSLKQKLSWNKNLHLENDANLFTLAEVHQGVGLAYYNHFQIPVQDQIAIGITLGTGVGGGLVIHGEIFSGAMGSSLEVGHISLSLDGPTCYCGLKGCSESYLSGTAIKKSFPAIKTQDFFHKINENSEFKNYIQEYKLRMLQFLVNLNNLFNPHYFVFGGGLSDQKIIFERLEVDLAKLVFTKRNFSPKVYTHRLGDSAGSLGALVLATKGMVP